MKNRIRHTCRCRVRRTSCHTGMGCQAAFRTKAYRLFRPAAACISLAVAGFAAAGTAPAAHRSDALPPGGIGEFFSEPHLFYPARYYPGVADTMQAQLIVLLPGSTSHDLILPMQPAGGMVSGRVLGAAAGNPVPLDGVLIEARRGEHAALTRSGGDGRFLLRGVPAGPVLVRYATDDTRTGDGRYLALYHPDAQDSSQAGIYEVADGETLHLDPVVLPRAGVLGGAVRTADTESPMPGRPVEISEVSSGRRWVSTTSAQGRFLQGGLPAGSYTVLIDAKGTAHVSGYYRSPGAPTDPARIEMRPGDFRDGLEILLFPGGVISGHIRTEDSTPVAGAAVRLALVDTGELYEAATDEYGFYEATGLPTGEYIVYAPVLNRYYPDTADPDAARPVSVTAPDVITRISITGSVLDGCRLPPGSRGYVHGIVDSDMPAVAGAFVRAVSADDTVSVSIDGPGAYLLDCLPRGAYRVGLYTDGELAPRYYKDTNSPAEARLLSVTPPDTTWEVDFRPEASVRIGGIVQDPQGRPIPGVRVRAEEPSMRLRAACITDEDGRFLMARLGNQDEGGIRGGLPAGSWRVVAESTLVPDPVVTPVMQPALRARALPGGEVAVSWTVAGEFRWLCRLHRSEEPSGDWAVIHECSSGRGTDDGAGSLLDSPPEDGVYRYLLRAWVMDDPFRLPEPHGGWSAWSEPVRVLPALYGRIDLGKMRLSPNPWDGGRDLVLQLDHPIPVDGILQLISITGRIVTEVTWPAQAEALIFTLPAGSNLATGVHFFRLLPSGRTGSTGATLHLIR